MTLPNFRSLAFWGLTAGLILCIGSLAGFPVAAGSPDDIGTKVSTERYARSSPGHGSPGKWVRESEMPSEPQKSPHMVFWEFTSFEPGSDPTPAQQSAADDLIERCFAAAKKHGWADRKQGLADDFYLIGRHHSDWLHYRNDEYMLDDRVLDPDHPEFLMYAGSEEAPALVGFMFMTRSRSQPGPEIGGPLTIWHRHVFNRPQCLKDGIPSGIVKDKDDCKSGVLVHQTPEMLHVWLIPRPEGPFSTKMSINEKGLSELVAQRKKERGF